MDDDPDTLVEVRGMMVTRADATQLAFDAWAYGTNFVEGDRQADGTIIYRRIDPTTIMKKTAYG